MSYKVSDQRIQTMLEKIGDAAQLVDNKAFLPFFRSAQIVLEKKGKADEWGKMITLALTKEHPSRYFAKLCKMVKDGTYKFVEAIKEVVTGATLWLDDKLIKFGFGKYHKYWRRKAQEFVNVNGQAGFVDLLEFAERKKVSQKYLATALKNCKPPQKYYTENVLGGAK
jgi:hypothetical protein